MFLNLKALGEKIGVEVQVVKSGPKKDMGSLWRGLLPEEQKIMQEMIDEYYERFLQLVEAHRPKLNKKALLKLADGRLIAPKQAKEAGLIDNIGYLEDALKHLKAMADLEDAQTVTYARSYCYVNNIYSGVFSPPVSSLNLKELLGLLSPGFYYLWYPGLPNK